MKKKIIIGCVALGLITSLLGCSTFNENQGPQKVGDGQVDPAAKGPDLLQGGAKVSTEPNLEK